MAWSLKSYPEVFFFLFQGFPQGVRIPLSRASQSYTETGDAACRTLGLLLPRVFIDPSI